MAKRALKQEEIAKICRELALLLRSGVPLGGGLELMRAETGEELLAEMATKADEGLGLSAILRETAAFPNDVCGMAEAGEKSGCLEEALEMLADYYDDRVRMNRQIRAAFLYPTVLLLIMLVVIVLLLTKVLPIFNDVYANLGSGLSGVAGGLFALGQILNRGMPVLCGVLVLGMLAVCAFFYSDRLRERLQTGWRKRFGNRGISRKFSDARFAMAMALGIRSGLSDEEAVMTAAETLDGQSGAKERCMKCVEILREEGSLPRALEQAELLPKAECRLLELGFRSGTGDAVMRQVAEHLAEEAENALAETVSRIEPTLVVVSSILVGMILLSVMLPLVNIMSAIG